MQKIAEILAEKGNEIWQVTPSTSVKDALQEMAARDLGALLVIAGNSLLGIFSERDFARCTVATEEITLSTPVGKVMTTQVYFVSPDYSSEECMALMTEKHIRHLPVMENDRLVGIITIGDIVKRVISDQEFIINELEKYIKGSYPA